MRNYYKKSGAKPLVIVGLSRFEQYSSDSYDASQIVVSLSKSHTGVLTGRNYPEIGVTFTST